MIKFLEKSLIYIFFLICIFSHLSYVIPESITLAGSVASALVASIILITEKINLKIIIIAILSLILLMPSIIISEEENILIPLMFFILPLLPFVLVPKLYLSHFNIYLLSLQIGVIISIAGVAVQIFISPDLFGLPGHPIYSGELIGTTSFRPTGFTGSPQNLALFMSVGLFLRYSKFKLINLLVKISVLITGASTLATFFAGAVFIYLVFSIPWIAIIAAPFVIGYLWREDFTNTSLEFFSISELGKIDERFNIDILVDSNLLNILFGYGPGTATQGMIDRFYVQQNIYGAESFPLIILHEFGIISAILLLLLAIKILYTSYSVWLLKRFSDVNIFGITIVLVASIFLTPNFASFRVKMIFMPFFLISLVSVSPLRPKKNFFYNGGIKDEVMSG
jgi:hypothetical protein